MLTYYFIAYAHDITYDNIPNVFYIYISLLFVGSYYLTTNFEWHFKDLLDNACTLLLYEAQLLPYLNSYLLLG